MSREHYKTIEVKEYVTKGKFNFSH